MKGNTSVQKMVNWQGSNFRTRSIFASPLGDRESPWRLKQFFLISKVLRITPKSAPRNDTLRRTILFECHHILLFPGLKLVSNVMICSLHHNAELFHFLLVNQFDNLAFLYSEMDCGLVVCVGGNYEVNVITSFHRHFIDSAITQCDHKFDDL
ncbi:hypothetical protein PUMCH_000036 [Australozyma saopauloensis]|uniref:Uncharacterized protein n=1 Tax=Australozyma saopauloensis TaxID=291208 RepID=A0AAX4H2K6_9ASCO|nr:hypothetical protein PUMCH_000036 [[Candida] saopauloensis]